MSIYEPTFPQWRKGKEPGKEAGPAGARGLRDFRHIASLAFDPPKIRISEEGRERRRRSLRETRATQKRDLEVPRYPHTSPHGGGLWDARVTTPPNPFWSRFFSWMTSTTGEQRKEEEGEEDVEKKGVARIKIGRGNPYFVRPSFLVRVTEQRWITRFMGREIKG